MTLEKSPRQSRIREALGRIYDQHPPHFREYLERFEQDPTSRVFAPLAEGYRRMGRIDDAIRICRKGLEHHPNFHSGRVALAKCLIDKKQFVEAKRELEFVIGASPENLLAERLLGDVHLALDEKAAAIHRYKTALVLAPNDIALSEKIHGLELSLSNANAEVVEVANVANETKVEMAAEPEPEMEAETASPLVDEETDTEDDFVESMPTVTVRDEDEGMTEDPRTEQKINALIGFDQDPSGDDGFQVAAFESVFEDASELHKEITTQTLAELYLSQGQFKEALIILQKIYQERKDPVILSKIHFCQSKLGVDPESLLRNRKIEVLKGILKRSHGT